MRIFPRFSALLLLFALAAPAAASAQQKKALTLDDYGPWSRINQVALSPDGAWMAYALQPNDGDARFFVKQLSGSTVHEATNGRGAAFSGDGRWVAFLTQPAEKEAEALRKQKKPVPQTLHVIDLKSGEEQTEEGVRAFTFSNGGRFLAIHRERVRTARPTSPGSDLLLRDLGQGTVLSFGNVAEYAFDEAGQNLAYLVDAAGEAGNGLYVVAAADGRIRPLSTGAARFEDLTWSETASDVAALRGEKPAGKTERANVLVVARGAGGPAPKVTTFDPSVDKAFPEGFVLSELANTTWTGDGARVVVGIKEQADSMKVEIGGDAPDVDVWHWADDRLQSVQMKQENGDKRFTYTSLYDPANGRFVRLATDDMPRVDIVGKGAWAVGRNDAPYRERRGHRGRPRRLRASGPLERAGAGHGLGGPQPAGRLARREVLGLQPERLGLLRGREVAGHHQPVARNGRGLHEPGVRPRGRAPVLGPGRLDEGRPGAPEYPLGRVRRAVGRREGRGAHRGPGRPRRDPVPCGAARRRPALLRPGGHGLDGPAERAPVRVR